DDPFFAVSSLHVKHPVNARVGIHSPLQEVHIVNPLEWGNIWVYGLEICLAGYLSRDEFRRRASLIQPGTRVFQYDQTKTKNLAVRVSDLKPLSDLFQRVLEWNKAVEA
ncbi:MAG: hypothetical protein AB1649_24410, partial [Chloroflexota bacterium]